MKILDELVKYYTDNMKAAGGDPEKGIVIIRAFEAEKDTLYRKQRENGIIPFGKHKGLTIDEILKTDKGGNYCKWLASQTWAKENYSYLVNDIVEKMKIV